MAGLWEWDTERFPDPEGMIRELNKKNIHLSLWNYPYLQENSPEYKALAERGFFIKNKEGQPALFNPPLTQSIYVPALTLQIRNFWNGTENGSRRSSAWAFLSLKQIFLKQYRRMLCSTME